jgi:hypothetical protein
MRSTGAPTTTASRDARALAIAIDALHQIARVGRQYPSPPGLRAHQTEIAEEALDKLRALVTP